MNKQDKPLARKEAGRPAEPRSEAGAVDAFVKQAKALRTVSGLARGRLVLALDATMSRQPTWDLACRLQGEMFQAAGKSGKLRVQLVYFRGFGECRASKFVLDTEELTRLMTRIDCRGGRTQIGKVLSHALKENERGKIDALVFIGDAMEENVDELADQAGRLGLRGVPVFVFQEGHDGAAEIALKEIARLSRGAWFRFDRAAAGRLAELLSAIAVYATGGFAALEARGSAGDRLLIEHMGKGR
ncbi:VWA domain-containing protein [Nitratireductor sp. CAU 1489]|uniref:VWA domain-containing protein n=1 Tax=Nitratireductor arenosus TaxID=2682096 RepID=A0A844QEZ6_9HYPH|nr:VWA domain-containing protein [Nitratireductor arenosus]MVA97912.1 VWA domain-containing protein [Nitratireductor arenosus]